MFSGEGMFLRTAMRYYRLWIYTCNAVLLVSVLVFLAVSIGILSNPNLALVPTPVPYHPTLLYGYFALFLQAGVLQTIGCLGALKLCQKLLNTYWFLLLTLLLCDLLVGFIWLIRFSHLTDGLRPYIRSTLQTQYGQDKKISEAWDAIQTSLVCCGAHSPMDFFNISSSVLPDSCCHQSSHQGQKEMYKSDHILRYVVSQNQFRPDSGRQRRLDKNATRATSTKMNLSCSKSDQVPNLKGCSDHIIKWYKEATETLMIFGFCVITFVKLCFVGILRFEIREMIQKIKVLQGDAKNSTNPELAVTLELLKRGCDRTTDNGGAPNLLSNDSEEGNLPIPTSQLLNRHNHISSQADGADSDTNSYCALITDTPVRKIPQTLAQQTKRKQNGNNNELTEMREFRHGRQTEI